jgi:hypothetical protein
MGKTKKLLGGWESFYVDEVERATPVPYFVFRLIVRSYCHPPQRRLALLLGITGLQARPVNGP